MAKPIRSIAELIRRLGGPTRVGRELGIGRNAISNWSAADEIPERWHARVLVIALRAGLPWRPPGWPDEAELRWAA